MPEENTVLAENGDVVEITKRKIRISKRVANNRSYVSQGGVYHDEGQVSRSRSQIAQNGLVCVSVLFSKANYRIKGEPRVSVFGVPIQAGVVADVLPDLVRKSADKTKDRKDGNDKTFAEELRIQVRRYIESICRFRCIVQIMMHRA